MNGLSTIGHKSIGICGKAWPLFFNRNGSARNKSKFVNPVQTIVFNFYAFYQAGFAESIGYHIANLYIPKHFSWGITV
jgi:hypothetical protein